MGMVSLNNNCNRGPMGKITKHGQMKDFTKKPLCKGAECKWYDRFKLVVF